MAGAFSSLLQAAAIATLSVAFSSYLNEIVPHDPFLRKVVSVLMIFAVAAVNVRGTRQSADLQNWTTAIKTGGILIMSIVLLYSGTHSIADSLWPQKSEPIPWQGFGIAIIGVLWAYEGWQFATFSSAEVIDPQRTYPRAFLFGMLTLIAVYLLANSAILQHSGRTKPRKVRVSPQQLFRKLPDRSPENL